MRSSRKSRSFETLEGRMVLDSTTVFNEVMYNPPGDDEPLEWIELHNQMAVNMDISRWRLADGVEYTFPVGTVIPGGGYLVVASNPSALAAAGVYTGALGPWTGNLANGGEEIELRNNSDRVMDSVNFGDNGSWPTGPDGSGTTLSKIDPLTSSAEAEHWRSSLGVRGTPSGENFPPSDELVLPSGVVSYWSFDEASGPATDRADGNHGALGAGATRVPGLVGSGGLGLVDAANSYVNVGPGSGNNFAVSTGVTVETVVAPTWDGVGSATLFRKSEPQGAPLISYWSFDESNGTPATAAVNDLVSGNNGTLTGTAVHTTGIRGLGAGRFNDSTSDTLSVGAGVGNNFSVTAGITIAAWIKPEWLGNSPTYDTIFYKNDAANRMFLEFQRDSSNGVADPPVAGSLPRVLSFGLMTGGVVRELDMPLDVNLSALPNGTANAGTIYFTAPAGALGPNDVYIKDGNAHHVAATYDVATGEKAIWIDGVKRWFRNYAAGTTVTTGGAAAAVIGNAAAPTGTRPFRGVIDEVAVWGDALSATQVAALATTATPLTIPSAAANNSIQLALQNDGQNASANPPVAAGAVLSFGLNVGGVYSELDMPLDGVAGRPTLAQLQDGGAHHIAATYNSATGVKAIWIDGTERFSVNLGAGATIASGGDGAAIIGNSAVLGASPLAGKIDEVAFWNRGLSSAEIQTHAADIQAGQNYFASLNATAAPLAFNETAAAAAGFWFELVNRGAATLQLGGHVIVGSENAAHRYVLPAGPLAAGAFLTVNEAQLGFTPIDGERLFLLDPTEQLLIDSVAVDNELRGRLPQGDGPWLFPDVATPGAVNHFALHDEIAINEIMYHARPQFAGQGQSRTTQLVTLGDTWRYEQSNTDLSATEWRNVGFDASSWPSGAAPLGSATGGGSYSGVVLGDAPLGYWRLNDAGPTVADASGNGRTGTADAGVVFNQNSLIAADLANKAANTVGASRVTVGGFEKFPAGSTGYSVEYWIKLNSAPTTFHNIVGDGESGGDFYLMNYITGGGQIRPHFNGAGTVSTDSNTTLQVGQVYHVVTTWSKTTGLGSIYINGVLDKQINVGTGTPINTNNPLYLGVDNREPGGNFVLDEVAVYNRDLSAGEVAEHFTTGAGNVFATQLTLGPTTDYFRKEFNFTGNPANTDLALRLLVDDGAVVYLNGQEIYRQNMPGAPTGHTTLASSSVTTATVGNPIPIEALLNVGANVLAVEVHQATVGDGDVAFAAELIATETIVEEHVFAESDEEWVELYNRSATTVDLSGWKLEDAVDYTFPATTTIAPGGYLVVAKNPAALALAHPGITVLGPFNGRLSDSSERIRLNDNHKNPADDVTYASDGPWSVYADGGGSSLELRDPDADNSKAQSWAASNEGAKSGWKTYAYRGVAANPPNSNNPATYNEFILGLLDAGEVLVDDVSVRENPSGAATQFLQNGTFQSDALGAAPATWRIQGTHHGTVVADPDNAANKVLRIVASGPAEHLANHAETTLKAGAVFETVNLGTEYEISFRAKWIAGSPQFNTRLFFNLLPKTTILDVPAASGTPGAKNSVLAGATEAAANIGPSYSDLQHGPVVPTAGQAVTVSVVANDPDGVQSVTLRFAVNGGALQSVPMTLSNGVYSGSIPGQAANAVVQFFVEGQDALGATSTFPAKGAASRALYKVGTTATSASLHNLQIIMTTADSNVLGASTNLMSNDPIGATVVYQGRAYYDIGIRLKGSEHGRPDINRRGFFLIFPPDNLFRGVHRSVALDRSGGWRYGRQNGQEEIVISHFINAAGNVPGSYNDLVNVEGPGVTTGPAILQMGRYTNVFLDSQYEDGGDGTRYEYELIYTMALSAAGNPESLKVAGEGPSVFGTNIRDKGDDAEAYRNNFLIKNNLDEDTFAGVVAMARALGQPAGSAAFHSATQQTLDVDEWLRAFAAVALGAVSDSYFNNSNAHNATFYQRPSDGRMLLFPQDMDFAFVNGATSSLIANSDLSNLLTSPNNSHYFYGHVQDIVNTSYNAAYMTTWVNYYNSLLPGQNITDLSAFIGQRATFALQQLPAQTAFNVSTTPVAPITTTLIPEFAPAKALVPSAANGGSALGNSWTQPGFVDTTWIAGTSGIGYENTPTDAVNYTNLVGLNVASMFNTNGSVFSRVPFTFTGNPADFDSLKLRMKYDDGFVAYLNGVEVARANAPTTPAWDSLSTAAHDDAQAVVFQDFDITSFKNLLVSGGPNVLAIHGMNTTVGSSDMLVLPALIAETIPDSGGDTIVVPGPTATVGGTGWVNVREIRLAGQTAALPTTWLSNTTWQATVPVQPGTHDYAFEAYDFQGNRIGTDTISITSTAPRLLSDHLRISEIMYHPGDPNAAEIAAGFADSDEFEFIELVNTSATATLDLEGVTIGDGVQITLGETSLAPGARTVVVGNQLAFVARYGNSISVAGQYNGRLNNAGEHLLLAEPEGNAILDFTYDDNGPTWHPTTDGLGPSLVIVDESGAAASWNDGASWRPSLAIGGSPGEPDAVLLDGDVNGDSRVDLHDLAILQAHLGTPSGALRGDGDLNADGIVDRNDAAILARNYGRSLPGGSAAPASLRVAASANVLRAPTARADVAPRLTAVRSRVLARAQDASASAADQALADDWSSDAATNATRSTLRAIRRR